MILSNLMHRYQISVIKGRAYQKDLILYQIGCESKINFANRNLKIRIVVVK